VVDIMFENRSSVSTLTGLSCPASHPEAMSTMPFSGVSTGLCSCAQGASFTDGGRAYPQSSSTSSCDTNQTKAGCEDDPTILGFAMPLWEDAIMLCAKRGGEGAVITANPYKERPNPSAAGACPSGYRRCGNGTTAVCFPSSEPLCPFTAMVTVAAAAFRAADFPGGKFRQLSSGDWLVASRSAPSLPMVEFDAGFRSVCIGNDQSYEYRMGDANLAGSLAVDFSCPGVSDASAPAGLRRSELRQRMMRAPALSPFRITASPVPTPRPPPSQDRDRDARYTVFASAAQGSLLETNFDRASGWCDAAGRSARAVPGFTGSCSSSDAQCQTVTSRTKCSKLKSYTSGDSNAGNALVLVRGEIPWKASCPIKRATLVEQTDPLKEIVDFAGTVTTVNAISNAFGLLLYINLLLNLCMGDSPCCPMSHEAEKNLIKKCKAYVDTLAKLARFIPLILLAQMTLEVSGFWASIADVGCTDAVTQDTLQFLSGKLQNAYLTYSATAAADGFTLLLSLYNLIKALLCPKVEDLDDTDADGETKAIGGSTGPTVSYPQSNPAQGVPSERDAI